METQLLYVKQFHEKMGFEISGAAINNKLGMLYVVAKRIKELSATLERESPKDLRFLYCHGILEEASEFAEALASGDKSNAAQELADLIYWILGAALAFDIPIVDAFRIVHASNMSKEAPMAGEARRVRKRGDNYFSPLASIRDLVEAQA